MKKPLYTLLILMLTCQLVYSQTTPGKDKIQILIVDGFSNHDWKQNNVKYYETQIHYETYSTYLIL